MPMSYPDRLSISSVPIFLPQFAAPRKPNDSFHSADSPAFLSPTAPQPPGYQKHAMECQLYVEYGLPPEVHHDFCRLDYKNSHCFIQDTLYYLYDSVTYVQVNLDHPWFKYWLVTYVPGIIQANIRADSRLAPSQWEASLQSNGVSHGLGANLESVPNIGLSLIGCVGKIQSKFSQHFFTLLASRTHHPPEWASKGDHSLHLVQGITMDLEVSVHLVTCMVQGHFS